MPRNLDGRYGMPIMTMMASLRDSGQKQERMRQKG